VGHEPKRRPYNVEQTVDLAASFIEGARDPWSIEVAGTLRWGPALSGRGCCRAGPCISSGNRLRLAVRGLGLGHGRRGLGVDGAGGCHPCPWLDRVALLAQAFLQRCQDQHNVGALSRVSHDADAPDLP
jgi:hypothetical protein